MVSTQTRMQKTATQATKRPSSALSTITNYFSKKTVAPAGPASAGGDSSKNPPVPTKSKPQESPQKRPRNDFDPFMMLSQLSQDVDGDMPQVNWAMESPLKRSRFVDAGAGGVEKDENSLPASHPAVPSEARDLPSPPPAPQQTTAHDLDILRSMIQVVARSTSMNHSNAAACSAPASHPPPHPLPSNFSLITHLKASSHHQNHSAQVAPTAGLSQEPISSRAIDQHPLSNRPSGDTSNGVWGTQEHKKSPESTTNDDKENQPIALKPKRQTPMTTGRKKKRELYDAAKDCGGILHPPSAPPSTLLGQTIDVDAGQGLLDVVEGRAELTDLLKMVGAAADLHSSLDLDLANSGDHEESQAAHNQEAPLPLPLPLPQLPLPLSIRLDPAPAPSAPPSSDSDDFDAALEGLDDEALQLALDQAMANKGAARVDRGSSGPVPATIKESSVRLAFDREESHFIVKRVEAETDHLKMVLHSEFKKRDFAAQLKDGWADTEIKAGDRISIVGSSPDLSGIITLDSNKGFLILNPDHLVSGTSVMASMRCVRQAYLQDQLAGDTSRAAVLGQLSHELLQKAVLGPQSKERGVNGAVLTREVGRVVDRNRDKLIEVGLSEQEAKEQLSRHIHAFASFHASYIVSRPGGPLDLASEPVSCKVTEVVDIEENIWAPRYGLKGQIDATLRVEVRPKAGPPTTHLVPFEFKSGKDYALGHRGQLLLYLVLMSERYGEEVDLGLLWNVGWGGRGMRGIRGSHQELAGLLSHRNRLVAAQSRPLPPPMLNRSHACNNCPVAETCALTHKVVDGGGEESQGWGGKDRFVSLTSHLSDLHCSYLSKFFSLVGMEEAHCTKGLRHQIWSMNGEERAKAHPNLCIPNLTLFQSHQVPAPDGEEATYQYFFTQSGPLVSPFGVGDLLVLSVDGRHPVLARVTLESVDDQGVVSVTSSRDIKVNKIQSLRNKSSDPLIWRLDRDESSSTFNTMRSNLLSLARSDPISTNLRKALIDLEPPVPSASCSTETGSSADRPMDLNPEQLEARDRSISLPMGGYLLIQGFPGSGKTSTLVHILRSLVSMGKRVLFTSYTNSAVDNALIKLLSSTAADKQSSIPLLRIGYENGVHDLIKPYLPRGSKCGLTSSSLPPLVAATCLSVRNPLLSGQTFDVCICDEASQVTVPSLLGPLLICHSFILLGDHQQLHPLVTHPGALEGGLGESAFSSLATFHPSLLVKLTRQYRMPQDIMDLSNELVYHGEMKCGSEGHSKLLINQDQNYVDLSPWVKSALDPDRRVVFIDTSHLSSSVCEKVVPNGLVNEGEAKTLSTVLKALLQCGLAPRDIGLTSPYKAQVDLMARVAADHGPGGREIESMTIDRYQGKEKACILLSFVRENHKGETGKLLADWRRINVAITRSSKKLIMIGHLKTLVNVPLLARLVEIVKTKDGIVNL